MSVSVEIVMRGHFPEDSANRAIAERITAAVRDVIEHSEGVKSVSFHASERLTEGQHRVFPDDGPYEMWGSTHEIFASGHFHAE